MSRIVDEHHGQAVCAAFDLSARIANASITEFVTTPTRMSLDSFNLVSHMPDHLVTLI